MGKTFKYIAESQLEKKGESGNCEICDSHGLLFYVFLDNDEIDPPEYLCVDCFKTQPLDWFAKHDEDSVQRIATERYPDKSDKQIRRDFKRKTLEEYRRTPSLPNLVNWGEWPVCCADFAEYIGDAELTWCGNYDDFVWYGPGDHCDASTALSVHVTKPDFLRLDPFSLFQCLTCKQKYWIHCV